MVQRNGLQPYLAGGRGPAAESEQEHQHGVDTPPTQAGPLDRASEAGQADQDEEDPLHDAQRAGLQANHMFQVQRPAHDGDAGQEREKEKLMGAGQGHGGSTGTQGKGRLR